MIKTKHVASIKSLTKLKLERLWILHTIYLQGDAVGSATPHATKSMNFLVALRKEKFILSDIAKAFTWSCDRQVPSEVHKTIRAVNCFVPWVKFIVRAGNVFLEYQEDSENRLLPPLLAPPTNVAEWTTQIRLIKNPLQEFLRPSTLSPSVSRAFSSSAMIQESSDSNPRSTAQLKLNHDEALLARLGYKQGNLGLRYNAF